MAKRPTPIKQARAIVAPQYAPLKIATAEQQRVNRAQQQANNAATLALVKQLGANIAPAGQTYDAAVAQQQALAHGAANLLAQANPNAQIQSDLTAVNAPTQQHAQLADALTGQFPGAGGVLNILQGSIPGASLVAQKAAQQQFLAGLPSVVALGGQRANSALHQQALIAAAQLAADRAKVAAQLPGLAQSIAQRQQDVAYRNQQAQTAINEAALNREFQANQAALGRQLTPYQKAQLGLARQQAALTQKNGGLTAYEAASLKERQREFNARQNSTKTATGSKRTGKQPSAKDLQQQASLAYYGQKPVVHRDSHGNVTYTEPGIPAVNYQTALFGMMNSGVPLAVAQRYLNQFYAPGEDGRPVRSFQQRQAMKKQAKRGRK